MITPTSRDEELRTSSGIEKVSEHVADRADTDDLDATRWSLRDAPLRQIGGAHSHLRCFAQSPFSLRHRSYLAAQSDLAEEDRRAADRLVVDARGQRAGDREIAGRLLHPHTANDVEKH